jgi:hypothetical protein
LLVIWYDKTFFGVSRWLRRAYSCSFANSVT